MLRRRERRKQQKNGTTQGAAPAAVQGARGQTAEELERADSRRFKPLTMEEMEAQDRGLLQDPIPDSWDDPPTPKGLSRFYWEDPEPGIQGMLSADRIRAYNYLVGRMIRPFQESS
jgi:hypothetical protein